ncbi:hypothetical protein EMQ25_07100 [Arsenicitalea aurantiaca]|uniref:Septum formation initiator family protein n=1 Tax=Arsenicitalea aurantiaca TaxID=1783274 RepID=A0A433XFN5_9HYPH|nr:septum formation initiator family protein [Arsenicitalea aurantiaca]RUT32895.1 hypothetical protein EMQ25_07100 [Arsenicitalea aurantiaca]
MSTRLKRPAFWRPLAVSVALFAFQGYLGYNVVSGQFGIESQKQMHEDIAVLQMRSNVLQAEIDAYRHRVELFNAAKLDPDILSERARALLSMAQADEVLIMVDPRTGLPILGSSEQLSQNQLTRLITSASTR